MARLGFVVHRGRDAAAETARALISWLTSHGHEVVMTSDEAALLDLDVQSVPADEFAVGLDAVVSLGGDGTMLQAVHLVAAHGIPIVGVNLGHLGYLTEVAPEHAVDAIEKILAGDFRLDRRMLLDVRVRRADGAVEPISLALNEAVVERSTNGRTVRVDVAIDGRPFTPYAADGLIVATPTGSTAYAFSARGPIVAPSHRAVLLTPVSPHMLFDRTLVLDAGSEVSLTIAGHRPATLAVDGRDVGELAPGDAVLCRAADHDALLVTFDRRDFPSLLKAKFGLADR